MTNQLLLLRFHPIEMFLFVFYVSPLILKISIMTLATIALVILLLKLYCLSHMCKVMSMMYTFELLHTILKGECHAKKKKKN